MPDRLDYRGKTVDLDWFERQLQELLEKVLKEKILGIDIRDISIELKIMITDKLSKSILGKIW